MKSRHNGRKPALLPLQFDDVGEHDARQSTYESFPSVWTGEDAELLDRMLEFYPRHVPEFILDATVNAGRFWRGSVRSVVGLDIERKNSPTVVGDNTRMPFRDGQFDVVIYDPPHIPNQGRDRQKDFNIRFGLVLKSSAQKRLQLLPHVSSVYSGGIQGP